MQRSRIITFLVAAGIILIFFLYAFWPRAVLVDLTEVTSGHIMITIDEEAKARVRDVYAVSMPAAGRLQRVEVESGDQVRADETVVARILPANPNVLDVRTKDQAEAAVEAADAALDLARADSARARADLDLARSMRQRYAALVESDAAAQAALDEADRNLKAAEAAARSATAAIKMRAADLDSARAMLTDFTQSEKDAKTGNPHPVNAIDIHAPISGVVLQVLHESETTLPVGTDILHIGDPSSDLEVAAELLSAEAVRVRPGQRVIIERWGGEGDLEGVVERIEPWAYTKISALGIEEQRANVIIRFDNEDISETGLGHGYRVYIRIVTWEDDTVIVPSNTLFREGDGWAVFAVRRGRARLREVSLGHNNGQQAEIRDGLEAGEEVILYPSDDVDDGTKVKRRG